MKLEKTAASSAASIAVSRSERQREAEEHSPLMMFDVMRAAAAVLVLLSHARSLMITDYSSQGGIALKLFYAVTGLGHQAVLIFFVISGYWVAGGVIKRVASERWSWGGYALDRLSRLWLVLIPALLLGFAFDGMGALFFRLPIYTDGIHGNTVLAGIPEHLGIGAFLTNVFFLQLCLARVLAPMAHFGASPMSSGTTFGLPPSTCQSLSRGGFGTG